MMSDDPILDRFADMIPGTKKTREDVVKERARQESGDEEVDTPNWVENPYYKRELYLDGEAVVFYTLAALAEALGRKPVTIRLWERQGTFPTAPFRTKERGQGKRIYTREQIEGVVRIAVEEGVLDDASSGAYSQLPLPPRFTTRVTELFKRKVNT